MKLTFEPYRLELKHSFRLATGVRSHTEVVYVKLEHEGLTTLGESSVPPYLGETVESVLDFLRRIDSNQINLEDLRSTRQYLDELKEGNQAAKAGVEMALIRMAAKRSGQSLFDYLGIEDQPTETSYTIGISNAKELHEKLEEAKEYKIIKLKLGSVDDFALIKAFREKTQKPFTVDVNQGWSDYGKATDLAYYLREAGCLFVEQPFHREDIDAHFRLKEEEILPVYGDESIRGVNEFRDRVEAFDGVVVKLMKTSGPLGAMEILREARERGIKTIMGCMAESSVAVAMARILAPLADFADLDGPLLLKNDPYDLLTYHKGAVRLPE